MPHLSFSSSPKSGEETIADHGLNSKNQTDRTPFSTFGWRRGGDEAKWGESKLSVPAPPTPYFYSRKFIVANSLNKNGEKIYLVFYSVGGSEL